MSTSSETHPLCVIDVLNDPRHAFSQVFENFLAAERLRLPYRFYNGRDLQTDYSSILQQPPPGILISGSLDSVYERQDWMLRLEDFIRAAHAAEIPIFGVCFGHQILATALGGQVESMGSWEFGPQPLYLQGEHPYLQGFASGEHVVQVHQDHVAVLPPGAVSLALSENTPHQIFTLGQSFGVQFHPEYTVEMLQAIIQNRGERIVRKGPFRSLEHLQALSAHWQLPRSARGILRNFFAQRGLLSAP